MQRSSNVPITGTSYPTDVPVYYQREMYDEPQVDEQAPGDDRTYPYAVSNNHKTNQVQTIPIQITLPGISAQGNTISFSVQIMNNETDYIDSEEGNLTPTSTPLDTPLPSTRRTIYAILPSAEDFGVTRQTQQERYEERADRQPAPTQEDLHTLSHHRTQDEKNDELRGERPHAPTPEELRSVHLNHTGLMDSLPGTDQMVIDKVIDEQLKHVDPNSIACHSSLPFLDELKHKVELIPPIPSPTDTSRDEQTREVHDVMRRSSYLVQQKQIEDMQRMEQAYSGGVTQSSEVTSSPVSSKYGGEKASFSGSDIPRVVESHVSEKDKGRTTRSMISSDVSRHKVEETHISEEEWLKQREERLKDRLKQNLGVQPSPTKPVATTSTGPILFATPAIPRAFADVPEPEKIITGSKDETHKDTTLTSKESKRGSGSTVSVPVESAAVPAAIAATPLAVAASPVSTTLSTPLSGSESGKNVMSKSKGKEIEKVKEKETVKESEESPKGKKIEKVKEKETVKEESPKGKETEKVKEKETVIEKEKGKVKETEKVKETVKEKEKGKEKETEKVKEKEKEKIKESESSEESDEESEESDEESEESDEESEAESSSEEESEEESTEQSSDEMMSDHEPVKSIPEKKLVPEEKVVTKTEVKTDTKTGTQKYQEEEKVGKRQMFKKKIEKFKKKIPFLKKKENK